MNPLSGTLSRLVDGRSEQRPKNSAEKQTSFFAPWVIWPAGVGHLAVAASALIASLLEQQHARAYAVWANRGATITERAHAEDRPLMARSVEREADVSSTQAANERLPVEVEIGANMTNVSDGTVEHITRLINGAYGQQRVSTGSVRHRLRAGRNRVLHVATREGQIVGVCSSTLFVPWAAPGCGHWGLLAVDPAMQGVGVGSALVAAAETRIADAKLGWVGMEYSYQSGDAFSERMLAWYEDSLRYVGPQTRVSGFRICRKRLRPLASAGDRGLILSSCEYLGVCVKWLLSILFWLCCGQY